MKTIKISLIVIVLGLLSFFAIRSMVSPGQKPQTTLGGNQSNPIISKIQQDIVSLSKLPDNKFCTDIFNAIQFDIDDKYQPHPPQYPYGRLGKTQLDNDQQKENLTKTLYAVYADKFIKQAFYVFNVTDWKNEDLNIIRNECLRLKISPMLQRNSPVDIKLNEIQGVVRKYDEISNFIAVYNNYSVPGDSFPNTEVQNKISRAQEYLNNGLQNGYVNKCTRLHEGLKGVPQALFVAHVKYLDSKIENSLGKYADPDFGFKTHKDYVNTLYTPLKSEIEELNNSTYNVPNFHIEYARLINKWSDDNSKAYKHFK